MYNDHLTGSNMAISSVLGPVAMTFSEFIEIFRSPSSPKVIENAGKVFHPLGQLAGINFEIFVTVVAYIP